MDFKFRYSKSITTSQPYMPTSTQIFTFQGQELVNKPISNLSQSRPSIQAYFNFKFHLPELRTSLQAFFNF